jgi:hypothetical protein
MRNNFVDVKSNKNPEVRNHFPQEQWGEKVLSR